MSALTTSDNRRLYLDIYIYDHFVSVLIDTGATNTVFNYDIVKYLNPDLQLNLEKGKLSYADGRGSSIKGSSKVTLTIGQKSWTGKVYFVDNVPFTGILGMDVMKALEMIVRTKSGTVGFENSNEEVFSVSSTTISRESEACSLEEMCDQAKVKATPEQEEFFEEFLEGWFDKFQHVTGITNVSEHQIYLKPGTIPAKQRYYPISPHKLKILHEIVDELIAKGLVEESTSAWSSPVLLVEKKSGGFRMAVDYRKLNSCTVPYAYPVPYMRDIFKRMKSGYFLSTIDLESGFYQIKMEESSKPYTAFTVPMRGLLQFKVMPFGLTNAPATFQHAMNTILRPVIGKTSEVYFDDIPTYSENFGKHVSHMDEVFTLLFNANMKINRKKSKFLQPYVECLGHIIGQGELHVSDKKIRIVKDFPPPRSVKQVRSFLGLINFYRTFIDKCAEKSEPLNRLLRKDIKFVWSEDCQKAFEELKEHLIHYPILRCPDFELPFEIHVDASLVGLGAVLIQRFDRKEHPIAYASKTLTKPERNYSVTERECLAIIFGLEHYREYVDGTHFIIITDHAPLTWLRSLKNPTGRLARWIAKIDQFQFTIYYRKGKDMALPDALSRIPYNFIEGEIFDEEERDVIKICAIDIPDQPDFDHITDAWYNTLRENIKSHSDSYPHFRIDGNKIYKIAQNRVTKRDVEKLVVPSDFRPKLMEHFHSSLVGAHFGAKRTFNKIQEKYYWPNMILDIKKYVKSCLLCQQYKASNSTPVGLMADYPRMFCPGKAYSVDIVGPLPMTARKNRFIVTAVDISSRWIVASPLRSATGQNIWKFLLNNIILEFGNPDFILCDNASNLKNSKFLNEQCKKFNIDLRSIPLYSPRQNMVERHHRSLNTALSIFARDSHRNWDETLPYVLFAMRNTISEATGFSPALLTFGRNLQMPYELFKTSENGNLLEFKADEYLRQLDEDLLNTFLKAKDSIEKSQKRQAHSYNLRRKEPDFNVGNLVWRKNHAKSAAGDGLTKKFMPAYIGPAVVVELLSPSQVRLETPNGKDLGRWHVEQLKHVM